MNEEIREYEEKKGSKCGRKVLVLVGEKMPLHISSLLLNLKGGVCLGSSEAK